MIGHEAQFHRLKGKFGGPSHLGMVGLFGPVGAVAAGGE